MFICHKMKFQVVRSIVSVGGGVAGVTPSLGLIVHRENRFWCPVTMLPIKSCSSKSRNSTKTVEETGKKSAHYPWNLIFKIGGVTEGWLKSTLLQRMHKLEFRKIRNYPPIVNDLGNLDLQAFQIHVSFNCSKKIK